MNLTAVPLSTAEVGVGVGALKFWYFHRMKMHFFKIFLFTFLVTIK